jgi:hypothetical protein
MLWSPDGHPDAVESVLPMVDVVLLDSDADPGDPATAFDRACDLLGAEYVVDLAWLRTTPWRERLASSFDPPDRRGRLGALDSVAIRHRDGSAASAMLLAGWLASRLGRMPAVELTVVDQDAPGLAGVTVAADGEYSLSLDRGTGGLRARERLDGGPERSWQVLGASRGEGGILGEGVRQALLRDPTYGPALAAARELCP